MRGEKIHRTLSLRGFTLEFGRQTHNLPAHPLRVLARTLGTQLIAGEVIAQAAFDKLALPGSFSLDNGIVSFSVPSFASVAIPEVAPNYGFKGGVARYSLRVALESVLGPSSEHPPRDIDLVRKYGSTSSLDEQLLEQLNAEDFQRGAGVEAVRSDESYFATRDLSINEVVVWGQRGNATLLALLDLVGCTLRPCKYRGGSLSSPRKLAPMTVAKCVRLAAEGDTTDESFPWTVVGVPSEQEVTSFAIAVQLKKVLQRDKRTTVKFLEYCLAAQISFVDPSGIATELDSAQAAIRDKISLFVEELFEDLPMGYAFLEVQELELLRSYLTP